MSALFTSCTWPSTSMLRTLSTTSIVQPCIAPAFMRSAPPRLPGMPSMNSKPPRSCLRASATMGLSRAPAPTVTIFALDLDAAEVGPAEMNAKAEDAAVANEQVAAAPDERDRDAAVVRETQAGLEVVLVDRLEPELRRAADAHRGVLVQRLVALEDALGLDQPRPVRCTRSAPARDAARRGECRPRRA